MKKNDDATRCKQCHKVIVGNGHFGVCDSCFNKDAEWGAGALAAGGALWLNRKKIGRLLGNIAKAIIKR